MTFDEWLRFGYDSGFCSPPCCHSHDGVPMTAAEEETYDYDGEVCVHVVRLFEDLATKKAAEANHPPSIWRALNIGWRNEH